jgi:hypothetical protein
MYYRTDASRPKEGQPFGSLGSFRRAHAGAPPLRRGRFLFVVLRLR